MIPALPMLINDSGELGLVKLEKKQLMWMWEGHSLLCPNISPQIQVYHCDIWARPWPYKLEMCVHALLKIPQGKPD